jgi:hypothetical protein
MHQQITKIIYTALAAQHVPVKLVVSLYLQQRNNKLQ